jgi:hypothetical protein
MVNVEVKTFHPCDINNPDFKHKSRVHDWRNYIPYEFQKIWKELPLLSRVILVIMAEEQATAEEWD